MNWEKLVEVLAEPVAELVKVVWKKLTGSNEDPPLDTLERLTRRTIDIIDEMRVQAELRGLTLSFDVMLEGARGVLDAFIPKGEFPNLLDGASVTMVPPDQTLDEVIAEPGPDDKETP